MSALISAARCARSTGWPLELVLFALRSVVYPKEIVR
jgi:hypothetical protein